MSGIYIPNAKLPKKGKCMTVTVFDDGTIVRGGESETLAKAVPVPDHGRLKDYDAIYAEYKTWFDNAEYRDYKSMFFALWNAFNFARIIIPADKED